MELILARRARRFIASPEYRSRRMETMNREIEFWLLSRDKSKTNLQREFCGKMAEMYHIRYQWYLKH